MSERLDRFLDAVTAEVRCQEVHAEIRAELHEHILSHQEGYIAANQDPDQALEAAIEQMGAPAEIGRRFDKVHRPRIEWGLLALTGLLTLVGLWVGFAGEGKPVERLGLLGIGLALGAPLLFLDYRLLRKWGWPLFGATGLILLYLFSPWHRSPWSIRFDLPYLFLVASPHLLALGLTAILSRWDWRRRWSIPVILGLLLLPVLLLYGKEIVSLSVTYTILWSVQFFAARPPKGARIAYGALMALGGALMARAVASSPFKLARLLSWLNLSRDPTGAGYHILQSLGILREGGLFGHGPFAMPETLPEPTSDFVFPYLVHTLGWAGGLVVLLLIAAFGLRLVRASRQIREPFGASLMRLIGVILLLDGGWNLLMVVGLLPITAAPLPFISGDGALVYQLALMGLALGIYRRKDLQPAPARTGLKPGAPA